MAITFITTVQSRGGTIYTFTVDGNTVSIRDDNKRTAPWTAFTMDAGYIGAIGVVEWPDGLLQATYILTNGTIKNKYSEDDGETWQ